MAARSFSSARRHQGDNQLGPVLGGIAGAHYVDAAAKAYGVPVILNTDHCAKKLLPWVDGMLAASEEQFAKTGQPLYSSHMLDLSEEPMHENLEICAKYLERMAKIGHDARRSNSASPAAKKTAWTIPTSMIPSSTRSPRKWRKPTRRSVHQPGLHRRRRLRQRARRVQARQREAQADDPQNSQDYIEKNLGTGPSR